MKSLEEYFSKSVRFLVAPVDPAQHTMTSSVLLNYISQTKFSPAQYELLDEAAAQGTKIHVYGVFEDFAEVFFRTARLEVVSGPLYREMRREKRFNNRRPSLYKCLDENNNHIIATIVFPSHEYVMQYAEIIATYCTHIAKTRHNKAPPSVTRVHYLDFEADLAEWSDLRTIEGKFPYGAHIIIGEVGEIEEILKANDFRKEKFRILLGPSGMYTLVGLQTVDRPERPGSRRVIFLLGVTHCYWGSAAGYIAGALVEAGARHIIYAAKAGTLSSESEIHKLFCPKGYCVVSYPDADYPENPRFDEYEVSSPIRDTGGFVHEWEYGTHISVPTVMGETADQHERLRTKAITVDNEIGHIARAISNFNERGYAAEFTALHFITDYLHDPRRNIFRSGTNDPKNLAISTDEYYNNKRKIFNKIGLIINIYAALTPATLASRGDVFKYLQADISEILDNSAIVTRLVGGYGRMLKGDKSLINFLLRSRYSAYYNNTITYNSLLIEETLRSFGKDSEEIGHILTLSRELRSFYQKRGKAAAKHVQREFIQSARLLMRVRDNCLGHYLKACCAMASALILARVAKDDATLGLRCIESAKEDFKAANLSSKDLQIELLNLQAIECRLKDRCGIHGDAPRSLLSMLEGWSNVAENAEAHSTSANVWNTEAACIQRDLLKRFPGSISDRQKEEYRHNIAEVKHLLQGEYVLLSKFVSRW